MVWESILAKKLVEKLLFEVICKIRHMCQKSKKIVFLKSIFGPLPKVMDKIWNHIRKAKIEQNSKMVSESILAKKLVEKSLFEVICKICHMCQKSQKIVFFKSIFCLVGLGLLVSDSNFSIKHLARTDLHTIFEYSSVSAFRIRFQIFSTNFGSGQKWI